MPTRVFKAHVNQDLPVNTTPTQHDRPHHPGTMVKLSLLAAAAALGCTATLSEAFAPSATGPRAAPRMSAAAAPKAAAGAAADGKKTEEPLLLRAAKGEVRCALCGVACCVVQHRGTHGQACMRVKGPRRPR